MKTISIFLILTVFIGSIAFSQEKKSKIVMHEQKREKIKAQKIAFITDNLDLTPDEAQLFWPVYNEYNKKLDEISSEKMKIMKDTRKNMTELTEKDAEILSDKIVEFKLSEANLLKEYHLKFKKTLSKTKILKLYKVEHKFKKQLLRNMKVKHLENGHQEINTD